MFGGDLSAVLLEASNSTCDAGLGDVPPPWQEIQDRRVVLHGAISELFTERKAVQTRSIAELPMLPSEFVAPLTHLDQQLYAHDAGICNWLPRMFHDGRRAGTQEEEWVDGEQPFYATVHISKELDPETVASRELSLSWRFPGSRFKRTYATDAKCRPFVEYQHWAGQSSINRPESQELTNELLWALLERIPELAFVAVYATSVILKANGMGS